MKKLLVLLSTLALSISSIQAKDKDYGVNVKYKSLEIGKSSIVLDIRSKSVSVSNAVVKLKVYHPNDHVSTYKINKANKYNQYIFNVNTPINGEYKYLLKFNRMGGVNHIRRGSWEL